MRTLTLVVLSLIGTALLADDAFARGKRGGRRGGCNSGCNTGCAAPAPACGGCAMAAPAPCGACGGAGGPGGVYMTQAPMAGTVVQAGATAPMPMPTTDATTQAPVVQPMPAYSPVYYDTTSTTRTGRRGLFRR